MDNDDKDKGIGQVFKEGMFFVSKATTELEFSEVQDPTRWETISVPPEQWPSVFDYLWFPANRELVYGLAEGEPKKRGDILKRQGNVVWPKFGGEK